MTNHERLEGERFEERNVISFSDLHPGVIRAPLLTTDVLTLRNFRTVEHMIVDALSPAARRGVGAYVHEIFASTPIDSLLRPAKFNGSLELGQVAILPFDPARAIAHNGSLKNSKILHQEQMPPGFGVIFMGGLRSSKSGDIGSFCVEATYYLKKYWRSSRIPSAGSSDFLSRTVGPRHEIKELEKLTLKEGQISRHEAIGLIRLGLDRVRSRIPK